LGRPDFHLILAGGGSSARFGRDKLWIETAGKPVLLHALEPFLLHPGLTAGVVTLSGDGLEEKAARLSPHLPPRFRVIAGGPTRSISVHGAFCALDPADGDLVVIHDAARPCLSPAVVDRLLALAARIGAAITALPVRDTLKSVDGDRVTGTVDRENKVQVQTPLIFRADLLRRAYARPAAEWRDLTDEAQMLEAMGVSVHWGPGAPENLKLTYPEDLPLIEAILLSRQR
jgi:2-C-methyl-D-erythritol 4-phosphate cytidylyltransferase